MQTSFPKFYRSVTVNFCRNRFWNERIFWLKFCFSARTVLYINCSVDNECLQLPLKTSFKEEKAFLNNLTVRSEPFAVLELFVGLLNICPINVMTVQNLEARLWFKFATEWLPRNFLPLVNVKKTIDYSHCALWSRSRKQLFVWNMFGCLSSKFFMSVSCPPADSFRKSFGSSWCLIYIQLLSQRGFWTCPRLYLENLVAPTGSQSYHLQHAWGGTFWKTLLV